MRFVTWRWEMWVNKLEDRISYEYDTNFTIISDKCESGYDRKQTTTNTFPTIKYPIISQSTLYVGYANKCGAWLLVFSTMISVRVHYANVRACYTYTYLCVGKGGSSDSCAWRSHANRCDTWRATSRCARTCAIWGRRASGTISSIGCICAVFPEK